MEEVKYTVAEDFEIPSKGLIYSKSVNPYVKLRSMTVRDEMKRTGKTNVQYKVLSDMIENCMLEKPAISVYDMHIGDFEYLLHKLRIVTYGEKYKMTVLCPYCGHVESTEFNLDTEEILDYNIDKFNEAKTVELKNGKVITLKFQTPRILDNISVKSEELASKAKDDSINFELLVMLEEAIDLVDGQKLSYVKLEEFVNSLSASDSNKIQRRIEKLNRMLGLKNEVKYTCSKCKEDVITFFRFGPEFFRPSDDE